MSNDPTNPVPILGALVFAAALVGVGLLIGCAVEWSTHQSVDWFSRDHTSHETNTSPVKP